MKLDELLNTARESITVKRVFSEPHEVEGVTVITAAAVAGGGGGGGGRDQEKGQEGEGGGFGMNARPAGAYVIRDGQVRWIPAFDVNRLIIGGCLVASVYLFMRARVVRARLRATGER